MNKNIYNALIMILLLFSILCIQSCTSPNAGTGTDTSTKAFAKGVISDTSGAPVRGSIIGLYPVNFNPITDTVASFSRDTSNNKGEFLVSSATSGAFNVIAHSTDNSDMGLVNDVLINTQDTSDIIKLTLKKCGTLSVALSASYSTPGGKLFIPGSPFSENIDTNQNITFKNLPEGRYPKILYSPSNSNETITITSHEAIVKSSDTSRIFSLLLVVCRTDSLSAFERNLIAHLESLGGDVQLMDDDKLIAKNCLTVSVILISASCDSKKISFFFTNMKVPVMVAEPNIFDDMGFTGLGRDTDFGTIDSQTTIRITSPNHPIAQKLGGKVEIFNSPQCIGWGRPEGAVSIITTYQHLDKSYATIFCYEKNAIMKHIHAPQRRVGFFMTNSFDLTKSGLTLFNNALFWLLEKT